MTARIVWIGASALNGAAIALIGKRGGNGKVGDVIKFAVIPVATIHKVLAPENEGLKPIQVSKAYMSSMKIGDIRSVCSEACVHRDNRKCYAQFNAQNVSEPVAMIRGACRGVTLHNGWRQDALDWLAYDVTGSARMMVVGSTGALPVEVSDRLVASLASKGLTPLGYVENWRDRPDLRGSHMASCYSLADVREAEGLGWRAFWSPAAEELGNQLPEGVSMCPGSKYRANTGKARVKCAACNLCDGAKTGDRRSSIVNIRHGNGDAGRVASLVRKSVLARNIINHLGRIVGAYTPEVAA